MKLKDLLRFSLVIITYKFGSILEKSVSVVTTYWAALAYYENLEQSSAWLFKTFLKHSSARKVSENTKVITASSVGRSKYWTYF